MKTLRFTTLHFMAFGWRFIIESSPTQNCFDGKAFHGTDHLSSDGRTHLFEVSLSETDAATVLLGSNSEWVDLFLGSFV